VQVSAPGQGSAGLRGVALEATNEPTYVELQLSGDGVVAGVLLDPDGRPVPRYRLWCLPAEHRDAWVGYLHDPQQIPHEWGGGLYGDHGSTDEARRFDFKGLQAGDYHPRGHTAKTGCYEELLTDRAVPSETHETRERLTNGDIVLDVQPGRSYVLGVFSRECELVEQRFDVTPGDYEHLITVTPPPPAPGTLLEVELQAPGGAPYEDSNTQRLYAPHSGRLLWKSSNYNQSPTAELAIGPGRYRWSADAEPMRGHHGERWNATPYSPVGDVLDVLPGRLNRFERTLGSSGRIELLVQSTRKARPSVSADGLEWEALSWDEQIRITNGGAAVQLVRADRRLRPSFNHGFGEGLPVPTPMLGTFEAPWVVPGQASRTVDAIAPGSYRLIVELDGLGTREQLVEVPTGALVEVTISFDD